MTYNSAVSIESKVDHTYCPMSPDGLLNIPSEPKSDSNSFCNAVDSKQQVKTQNISIAQRFRKFYRCNLYKANLKKA